jgi:hypothetical protein
MNSKAYCGRTILRNLEIEIVGRCDFTWLRSDENSPQSSHKKAGPQLRAVQQEVARVEARRSRQHNQRSGIVLPKVCTITPEYYPRDPIFHDPQTLNRFKGHLRIAKSNTYIDR